MVSGSSYHSLFFLFRYALLISMGRGGVVALEDGLGVPVDVLSGLEGTEELVDAWVVYGVVARVYRQACAQ